MIRKPYEQLVDGFAMSIQGNKVAEVLMHSVDFIEM
jgi:hypothetical protein